MDLRSKFEALKAMKEEQETRVRYHETKIQNMVIGYLIWGRSFLFFAINSQTASMSFNCMDIWWLILASTLFCALIYFLLFMDAVAVFLRSHYQLDLIRLELMGVCQQILVSQNQDDDDDDDNELGDLSSTHGFGDFGFLHKILMLDHFTMVDRKFYIFFTVFALLAITAIELYVSKYLFCN